MYSVTPSHMLVAEYHADSHMPHTMLCLPCISNTSIEASVYTRTYAMMLTCFPLALSAMLSASFADLFSILPLGGTAATITSMPLFANASVIPRQYCMPGIN
jgi:hypothetical protein